MKFALSAIAAATLFLGIESSRADLISLFPEATVIYVQTNSQAITLTNQTLQFFTNNIAFGLYHTFQVNITGSDTNTVARVAVDRSIDGSNWTIVGTNANAALSTTGAGEQTMTGKWYWARYRVYGSNVTGTVVYMGGR